MLIELNVDELQMCVSAIRNRVYGGLLGTRTAEPYTLLLKRFEDAAAKALDTKD